MAIDKELFFASDGLKYPVVARPYTDDMEVKEKFFTKADMVAMLEELKKEIIELPFPQREPEYMQGYSYCQMNILDYVIQEKINKLKGEEDGKDN